MNDAISKARAYPPAETAPPAVASATGVLQLIWRERNISRAEIARVTGLSRSTVSTMVANLLRAGLVAEEGAGPSRGGRRPIVLRFVDAARCILGIDLGATHVAVALTDLRGRVLAWERRRHPVRTDPAGTLALAREFAEACLGKRKGQRPRLLGIGVSVPSPVDPKRPGQVSDLVLPRWKDFSVSRPIEERFGVPVLVDNDANLGALAEGFWGAGRGVEDFAFIKAATGVGAGHIIRGQIYRGASGLAGEIGHLSIDPHGEPCVCGLRGCLTTFVGAQALVARAGARLGEHPGSALAGQKLTLDAIVDAALARDPLALEIVREAAEALGVAIADMLNLMNPAVVIIGGGLARLGDLLLGPLREVVKSRTLILSAAAAEIVTSGLGEQAVAIGAATLVLQRALADPLHFRTAARGR